MIVAIIFLLLVCVSLLCGIIFLLFHLPKKFGHPKLGRWLGGVATVIFAIFLISFLFSMTGWVMFPKNKVRHLLKDSSIELVDRFKILDHENIGYDIHGDISASASDSLC